MSIQTVKKKIFISNAVMILVICVSLMIGISLYFTGKLEQKKCDPAGTGDAGCPQGTHDFPYLSYSGISDRTAVGTGNAEIKRSTGEISHND